MNRAQSKDPVRTYHFLHFWHLKLLNSEYTTLALNFSSKTAGKKRAHDDDDPHGVCCRFLPNQFTKYLQSEDFPEFQTL